MHAKKMSKNKIATLASIVLTGLLCLFGGIIWATAHNSPSNAVQTVVTVPQPPSAAQIAQSENCTKFTDAAVTSTAKSMGVLDAGTCWVDGKKYGLDTFVTPTTRDSWLKIAEPVGVSPKWETATSVTYPSVANGS